MASVLAPPSRGPESEEALANVYKLGARRWRSSKKRGSGKYGEKQDAGSSGNGPFAVLVQKFRRGQ